MGSTDTRLDRKARYPWGGALIIGILSVAAVIFCRAPAEVIWVDIDGLEVARKMPGTKPVPDQDLEALRIAAFRWMIPNDPPLPNHSVIYLSVVDFDGIERDPSAAVMAAGMFDGGQVKPARKEPSAAEQIRENMGAFRYIVGFPVERPEGHYEIVYGYDCTVVCLATISLFMTRSVHGGWRVYDNRMKTIR
jgi:hypothetical protein